MSVPRPLRRSTIALGSAALMSLVLACGSDAQVATTTTTTTTRPDALAEPLVGAADDDSADDPADDDSDGSPDDSVLAAALRARSAGLAASDFPSEWSVVLDGGVGASGPGACSSPVDADGATLAGIAVRGPTMQLGEAPAFVSSAAHVFETDAEAARWIEVVRSPEWADCRRRSLDAVLAERDATVRLSVGGRDHDQLGTNAFEAFTELRGDESDGDLELLVHVLHHRRDDVVLESTLERSIELSDAQWAAVDDAHAAALATAWARLSEVDP